MDDLLKHGLEEYDAVIEQLTDLRKYSSDKLTLEELDDWRNSDLPRTLAKRYTSNGNETWLTKEELIKVMDWKLAKGKYRPTLPKLIKSNDEAVVEDVTREALTEFIAKRSIEKEVVKKCLNKLCELRGVGPATSSLILSLLTKIDPEGLPVPPFFSDETFVWFNPDYGKMKYNLKEYLDLLLPKYLKICKDWTKLGQTERATWAIEKASQLNPEFKVDPPFLRNYDTYIQEHKIK